MLNRKSTRSVAAENRIKELVPEAKVVSITCDLQEFASVKAAAAEMNTQFAESGVDVIACNAGVMANADEATADGYDVQMQSKSFLY